MSSSPPGVAFVTLRRRLQASREAGAAWTARHIAADLHAFAARIGSFEGGAAAAADAVGGLRLRRELVEACASRAADTQPSEAAALEAVAELVGDACTSLVASGDVRDPAVVAALAILQHEITMGFPPGE
jgi:hypothetical protein